MRVTGVPDVVDALRTVPKVLEKILEELEFRGIIKTIETIVLSTAVKKLRRVMGDLIKIAVTQTPVKGH